MVNCGSDSISVLYVDGDSSGRERLSSALAACDGVSIDTESTIEGTLARLESTASSEPIDCLVSAQLLADGTGLELFRVVRDRGRDPPLPFVLYPVEGNDRIATEASVAGVTCYLSRSVDDSLETFLECVRSAVAEAERSQRHREGSSMLDSLLEELPISLYFKDRAGRHVRISDEVGTDTRAIDPIGKTDPEVYAHEIGELAWESYEDDLRVIETGGSIVGKEEAWATEIPGVETIWLQSTKVPWREENGDICGLVGVTHDISELKRREDELEHQRQRLDRFASFVSHDLRNPLSVAQGYLELTREATTGTETTEHFDEVERALTRMERLIDDLLEVAGDEIGVSSVESVRLDTLVEDIWAEVGVTGSTLVNDVPDGAVLTADERLLNQLFANLFRNAIQHAGSDVSVVVGTLEGGFFVEDDGPGIPEADREAVFEFGHTGATGGTGMGLAFVAQIATAHGWDVKVTEGSSGGARFEVQECLLVSQTRALEDGTGTRLELSAECDVGEALPPGESQHDEAGGRWVVRGGGENVWNDIDECHFVHTPLEGDGRIVARVAELEEVDEYSKAGVMIRGEQTEGAPLGYVGVIPSQETELIWRPDRGRGIVSRQIQSTSSTPAWYRLDRTGEQVMAYHSADGVEWVPIDQRTVELGDTAFVGLAVCSHDPTQHCTGVFEDVSVLEY